MMNSKEDIIRYIAEREGLSLEEANELFDSCKKQLACLGVNSDNSHVLLDVIFTYELFDVALDLLSDENLYGALC